MKKYWFVIAILFLFACKKEIAPRPYGYFRVDLPTHDYVVYDSMATYGFDISRFACVEKKRTSQNIDIHYPAIDGTIYCTYETFEKGDFYKVSEESRTLAYNHVIRAEAITERVFVNEEEKVYGILYDFKGNAASPVQFFLTDSLHQYFRGSLYFNARPNADSIAPMMTFVREDIVRLIESFKWK